MSKRILLALATCALICLGQSCLPDSDLDGNPNNDDCRAGNNSILRGTTSVDLLLE